MQAQEAQMCQLHRHGRMTFRDLARYHHRHLDSQAASRQKHVNVGNGGTEAYPLWARGSDFARHVRGLAIDVDRGIHDNTQMQKHGLEVSKGTHV